MIEKGVEKCQSFVWKMHMKYNFKLGATKKSSSYMNDILELRKTVDYEK